MPTPNPQAAATKEDIGMLMQEMGKLYDHVAATEERMKQHFDRELVRAIRDSEGRLLLVVEQLRHDVNPMYNDKISLLGDTAADHGHRITRLERHAGIAA